MISLKLANINDIDFMTAANKVDKFCGFTAKSLFDWNKFKSKLDREEKRVRELYAKIVEKHAEKDEKGNVKIENKNFVFKDMNAFNKDIAELLSQPFEIKCSKIVLDDMLKVGLSAREIRSLSPIIEGDVGVEDEETK